MVIPSGGVFLCNEAAAGGWSRKVSLMIALRCGKWAIFSCKTSCDGAVMYGETSSRSRCTCSGCCTNWYIAAARMVAVVSLPSCQCSRTFTRPIVLPNLPASITNCASPHNSSHCSREGCWPLVGATRTEAISGISAGVYALSEWDEAGS